MRSSTTAHTQILATLSDSDKVLLLHEADYFQLADLVELLKRPTCTRFMHLTIPKVYKDLQPGYCDFTPLQDYIRSGWTIASSNNSYDDDGMWSFLMSKA